MNIKHQLGTAQSSSKSAVGRADQSSSNGTKSAGTTPAGSEVNPAASRWNKKGIENYEIEQSMVRFL